MHSLKMMTMAVVCWSAVTLSAQAKFLPAPSGEGVNRAQSFDSRVADPTVYQGNMYFIWGSKKPKNPAPAVGSKYLPYSRDFDLTHTFEWYQKFHPDWVEYVADQKTPAYEFFVANRPNPMAIDITNPEAREWYWDAFIQPGIDAGYPMFAFDNIDLENGEKRTGHFDKSGKWIQQFTGERVDPVYEKAVMDWIQYLVTRLHRAGIGIAANMTYPLVRPQLLPAMRELVEMVDLWGDEQGFTAYGDVSDEKWQLKFDFVRSIEKEHIYWSINETTGEHLAEAPQRQIDWAVANYYLYREKDTVLTLCGTQEYGVYLDTPALRVNLGHPISDPQKNKDGAWSRTYSRGIVAVNPSSKQSATVTLPPGIWVDSNGGEHSRTITLIPVSGVMLQPRS